MMKSGGSTPTTVWAGPFSLTVFPTTFGSPPKQHRVHPGVRPPLLRQEDAPEDGPDAECPEEARRRVRPRDALGARVVFGEVVEVFGVGAHLLEGARLLAPVEVVGRRDDVARVL